MPPASPMPLGPLLFVIPEESLGLFVAAVPATRVSTLFVIPEGNLFVPDSASAR